MGPSQPGRDLMGKASEKGALFLSDPCQRKAVGASTSHPQLPQPDLTQELELSSPVALPSPCSSSAGGKCGVGKSPSVPYLSSVTEQSIKAPPWGRCLFLTSLLGSSIQWGEPPATEGDEPVAAPLPGTGDSGRLLPASQSPSRVCENTAARMS